MIVKVYLPETNDEQQYVLSQAAEGIPDAETERLENYRVASAPDVAVVFGDYQPSVPYSALVGRVKECQKYLGKKTLVINQGFIKRGEYYSVGWNGSKAYGDYCNDGSPDDRVNTLLKGMLIPAHDGGSILVCGQVPWSASVYASDHIEWLRQVVLKLTQITDKPIRVRPHPDAVDNTPNFMGTEWSVGVPLEEDLKQADVVVTFNSNVAVDAILASVPVIAKDDRSIARSISDHFIEMLNSPTFHPRNLWLCNLAYAQWTPDEMASGLMWDHLRGKLEVAA